MKIKCIKVLGKILFVAMVAFGFSSCALLGGFFDEPRPVSEEVPEKPTQQETPQNTSEKPNSTVISSENNEENVGNYGNANVSQLEKAVLIELNKVRSNPPQYANEIIKQYVNTSSEAMECYQELLKTKSMPKLEFSSGLCKAADWLVSHQGPKGITGHYSSVNGYKSPQDRMSKFGMVSIKSGENISYGFNDARAIVVVLLIDQGVASRGHRKNILTRDFRKIGVGIGPHKKYRYMCVMDFAGNYKSR